ncbi:MAG: glutaminyl-peptide cyclotransferase [Acidimicrobiaceae bacterium]|nr:glutaminyl-peptide cyclotransferase [Acidimicrobiaceae bacterium]
MGPFLAVLCLCCLTASACSSPADDLRIDAAATTTTNTAHTPTSAADSEVETTLGAIADHAETAENTGLDTSPGSSTSTTLVSTGDNTSTTLVSPGDNTSTTTAGGDANTTTASPSTTTAGGDANTTTTSASTTTAAPVEAVVSPWPQDPRATDDREWTVRIETSWSHDTDAFTQGLETRDGITYESTGLYGESRLRALDGAEELRSVAIDSNLFGEGLTLVGEEIIQLSWREGRALRWDRGTFEPLGEFRYEGEGWGICWDQVGSRLLMSDGTATLTHRNHDDFRVVATTTVVRDGEPVRRINELECVEGLVVANIWMTDEIIVFDPDSGDVLVSIDAAPLAAEAGISADETHAVLNGVAYRGDGKWILGGKNWPLQFLVTLTVD